MSLQLLIPRTDPLTRQMREAIWCLDELVAAPGRTVFHVSSTQAEAEGVLNAARALLKGSDFKGTVPG